MSKSVIVLTPLIVLSVATTVMAGYKILSEDSKEEVKAKSQTTELTATPTLKATETNIIPTIRQEERNAPTTTTKPEVTSVNNNNKCIVTLQGQSYDVTTLRSSHPGGDIFVCGTDMTAKYIAQHGNDLSRMSKYLVGSSGTTTNLNASGGTGNRDRENERDDD